MGKNFSDYYNSGIENKKKRNFDLAIDDFNFALKLRPKNSDTILNRGIVYLKKREIDFAIKDFNEVIKINPKLQHTYIHRGKAYLLKDDYEKAIKDFDKAIELDPKNIGALTNRGNAHLSKKEFDKAIEYYNKVLKISTNYQLGYCNRGIAYKEKGDYAKAIKDFDKCISLNPNFFSAHYYRGFTFKDKGDYIKAIKDFETCIKINPKRDSFLVNLIRKLRKKITEKDELVQNKLIVQEINQRIAKGNFKAPDYWGKVKKRISQNIFREKVLENFGGICCVCGLDDINVLEAAHIQPWNTDKNNRLNPSNGLCLCSNHHKFFDNGYFQIDNSLSIRVKKEKLDKSMPQTHEQLMQFNGKKIYEPKIFKLLL